MQINEKLIKYNFSSRNNTSIKYIVIHDTGNVSKGADANAHFTFFNTGNRNSSAHYFIDSTQVLRIIKDEDKAWHCGDGKGKYGITNENSIGIELCINIDDNFKKTLETSAELASILLKKYNLGLDKLVRHFDASRKMCPNIMSKNNWEMWSEFRDKVKFYYNDSSITPSTEIQISDNINDFIDNIYTTFLKRPADPGGRSFWYKKIKSKENTIDSFVISIMNSDEFKTIKQNLYI